MLKHNGQVRIACLSVIVLTVAQYELLGRDRKWSNKFKNAIYIHDPVCDRLNDTKRYR